MKIKQTQTESGGVFEALQDDRFAGKLEYTTRNENEMVIEHTEVDPGFQGDGIGKKLVHESAEYARKHTLKILPLCSYAKKILERTSEFEDVLK